MKLSPQEQAFLDAICKLTKDRHYFTPVYLRIRRRRDHVIPVSRGGTSEESNLVTACFSCNRSKRAKLLEEWMP